MALNKLLWIVVFLVHISWVGLAHAAQVSATMAVTATMVGSCTIGATPMRFPAYYGSVDVTSTATVISNCTSGQNYMVHLDAGNHFSGAIRHVSEGGLVGGPNQISYQLYQGATTTTPWGDAGNAGGVTNIWPSMNMNGTGLDQVTTVTGKLFGGANVPVGSYSDVINITVTY